MSHLFNSWRRHVNRVERGQILAISAGGMIIFMLMVGLVIDAGVGFHAKRDAQAQADLAALAGTKVVADLYLTSATPDGSDVYAAVVSNLAVNGCIETGECEWTATYVRPDDAVAMTEADIAPVSNGGAIPAGTQGIRVEIHVAPETFFMGLVGMDTIDINVEATALTSSFVSGAPPGVVLPIAIYDGDYQSGTVYQLTSGDEGPGNFGWLSWHGSTAATVLGDSICTPDNDEMTFPVWVDGSTGVMNSSTVRDCIDAYIASGTEILVPLWRQTNNGGGSHLQYEVVGLAAFILTEYDEHAVTVNGRFVDFYALPSVPAGYSGVPCSPIINPEGCNNRTNFIGLTR